MKAASGNRGIPGWVRVAISLTLIGALLLLLDLGQIGATLLAASPLILLILLCVVYGERLYSALRWYQILRWSGANVPLHKVVRITFISAFAGLFLPGVLGTEAFRVIGLARHTSNLAMAFSSVLVDRMLAVLTLIPFVLIGLAFAPAGMPEGIRLTAWVALGAVLLSTFLLLHPAPRSLLEWVLPPLIARRVGPHLERIYAALDTYRKRPIMFLYAIALATGFQLLRVVVVGLSAAAVGVHLPIAYYFIFAPIIVFISFAPISFASIGAREAAYVYLFSLVGVAAEQAFAASVLVQFIGLLSCLPGAWLYARRMRVRSEAQEVRLCVHSSPEQPVS